MSNKNAIISIFDKTNVVKSAKHLINNNYNIHSTRVPIY